MYYCIYCIIKRYQTYHTWYQYNLNPNDPYFNHQTLAESLNSTTIWDCCCNNSKKASLMDISSTCGSIKSVKSNPGSEPQFANTSLSLEVVFSPHCVILCLSVTVDFPIHSAIGLSKFEEAIKSTAVYMFVLSLSWCKLPRKKTKNKTVSVSSAGAPSQSCQHSSSAPPRKSSTLFALFARLTAFYLKTCSTRSTGEP